MIVPTKFSDFLKSTTGEFFKLSPKSIFSKITQNGSDYLTETRRKDGAN